MSSNNKAESNLPHSSTLKWCYNHYREALEPICQAKALDIESLGVYMDSDRSAALPLHYDIYSLSGHILHVIGKMSATKCSARSITSHAASQLTSE